MKRYITNAAGAPAAVGPYSQAVSDGGLAFLSGQIALDPDTGNLVDGGIEAQTKQIMANLQAVLADLGLDFSHVLKATIYLTDIANFKQVNAVYEACLEGVKPARATVGVASLPLGAEVEIEMIASHAAEDIA